MTMWIIIFLVIKLITLSSILFISQRLKRLTFDRKNSGLSRGGKFLIALLITGGLFAITGLILNFINAVVIIMHLAVLIIIADIFSLLFKAVTGKAIPLIYRTVTAGAVCITVLVAGWYLDHHIWRTEYTITTGKNITPFKAVMFADSHIGTTFDAKGFAGHLENMKQEKPDVILIVGDFVDDDTSKEDMINSCRALGELSSHIPGGIYFVFGNHDKGYYGSARRGFSVEDLSTELQKNGIQILKDTNTVVNMHFNIFGRLDKSIERELFGTRMSPEKIAANLDPEKYTIILDHQPTGYTDLARSGIDLVLSGHTHGGQIFPLNETGKIIGAVDAVYGHEKRNNTDFIVTSGISDWALKFKTGTKSEYVVINIRGNDSGESSSPEKQTSDKYRP